MLPVCRRRSGSVLFALLASFAGACNPSFDPDWQEPGRSQVTPELEAGMPTMPNPAPEPSEAGQDAAQDAEADASALPMPDASIVAQPPPLVCRVDSCPDGGAPGCKAICTAVPCNPSVEQCLVDCALCGVPLK